MKQYQFVSWFPNWHGLSFIRLDTDKTYLGLIYEWILFFAFWEIRKWSEVMTPATVTAEDTGEK